VKGVNSASSHHRIGIARQVSSGRQIFGGGVQYFQRPAKLNDPCESGSQMMDDWCTGVSGESGKR